MFSESYPHRRPLNGKGVPSVNRKLYMREMQLNADKSGKCLPDEIPKLAKQVKI